jgi:hypothetical protein
MRGARLLQLTVLLTFLLVLPGLAQAPTDQVLTNADIVKMMKAGLPESVILREIRMSNTDFATSPAALIELKKQGASETILGAVLDSQMGIGQSQPGPRATPRIVAQVAAPGLHHLPSVEADMRINSTANGHLSMGHNHIQVEHSGMPVFSLEWREIKNPSSNK